MIPADINEYSKSVFTPDLQDAIADSFELFELFSLSDYEYKFSNILMMADQISNDEVRSNFISLLNNNLDLIINSHEITLIEDVSIIDKNEILRALYSIQDLLDYSPFLPIIESESNDEEILADILCQLCTLSDVKILSLLSEVKVGLINKLKQFIYTKEENKDNKESRHTDIALLEKLKLFKEFCGDYITIGTLLVENSVIIGLPLNTYIKYLTEIIEEKTNKDIAYHIFSLLLMSKEYHNNPILGYKENTERIFSDITKLNNVEMELSKLNSEFETFILSKKIGQENG